jgi:hypothetical protein
MKLGILLLVLAAVFLTATLVTAFAMTLFASGSGSSFLTRFWHNTLQYGWAGGIATTLVFWLLRAR